MRQPNSLIHISQREMELASVVANRELILVGRASNCHGVLRAPKVESVHFLIRWHFQESLQNGGYWTVTDVSSWDQSEIKEGNWSALPPGRILMSSVVVGGFQFSLSSDDLGGGPWRRPFLEAALNPVRTPGRRKCLQAVTLRDSDLIVGLEHYYVSVQTQRLYATEWLEFERISYSKMKIRILSSFPVNISRNGSNIIREVGHDIIMDNEDLVVVGWANMKVMFQIVDQVAWLPPAGFDPLKTLFGNSLILSLLAVAALTMILPARNYWKLPERQRIPPRVATLEIRNFTASEASFPSPPRAAPAVAAQNLRKSISGLNSMAKRATHNKSGAVAHAKMAVMSAKVRADTLLNEGIVSRTLAARNGDIMAFQPPSGEVSTWAEERPQALEAASTSLAADRAFNTSAPAHGPVAADNSRSLFGLKGAPGVGGLKYPVKEGGFSISGGLSEGKVLTALEPYQARIKDCYDAALTANSHVRGTVVLEWTISPTGKVTGLLLRRTTVHSLALESCVKNVLKGITFPKSENNQPTIVIYPVIFKKIGHN